MDVLGHPQLSITMDLYSHDAECLARCGRRDGSGTEEKSMIGGRWWWTVAVTVAVKAGFMATVDS